MQELDETYVEKHLFYNVFPKLKAEDKIREYFTNVIVEHVVNKKGERKMYVITRSDHILSFDVITSMEKCLEKYLSRYHCRVCIRVRYNLSSQYDLKSIMDEFYRGFVMPWFRNESVVYYTMLSEGRMEVEDNHLKLTLNDDYLSRSAQNELTDTIKKMLSSCFGLDVDIETCYEKMSSVTQISSEAEHRYASEVRQNASAVMDSRAEEKNTSDVPTEKPAESPDRMADYKNRRKYMKPKSDPGIIYGREVEGELTAIRDIDSNTDNVVIRGQIFSGTGEKELDQRKIRGDRVIVTFAITDFTDSIRVKLFLGEDELGDFLSKVRMGGFYRIKGRVSFDTYDKELQIGSVQGIKADVDTRPKRVDNSLRKRVELHLHTVMSEMDACTSIEGVIKQAKSWGHKALAITDHGVAQAFPIANHQVDRPGDDFKVIYGCEAYIVDDLHDMVLNEKGQSFSDSFVVFDIETTGFSCVNDRIIEIGAVKIQNGEKTGSMDEFVNPERPIPFNITNLTTISDETVKDADTIDVVLRKFLDFCGDSVLVAHNAEFDTSFIRENCMRLGLPYDYTVMDTMEMAHVLLPELHRFKLDTICKHLKIRLENHHRAVDDAGATADIFLRFMDMLDKRDIKTLKEFNDRYADSEDKIRKASSYHAIILVRNEIGRVNLYRLISASHLKYFNRRPRMPKSLINKYREGLILGSACSAGELYDNLVRGTGREKIDSIVRFYDYLEIQPVCNNLYMIDDPKSRINSVEDLQNVNREIVRLGEEYHKPVVATCDVHFLNPEDAIYRAILLKSKGFSDADNMTPLYFRTTEEMLSEFSYLGAEKAREVVIDNTNLISDMIEKISPVYPDKCPPQIENSDKTLTDICYKRAHEIYGPELPPIVKERLERELNSIIKNGFAVMYIIAQKLVWDSNDHGYLVGSRGSVGSSFVATMAGITEVNPLPAHYICPKCHYVDFDSELVKSFSGSSGCDMPDRKCPVCGTELNKDGHDIPFETFLGFKGDKEPDIDLNFSGEYQAKAHKYTEVLFGKGHAFRAGTIGGVADKTAYGYTLKYFEDQEREKIYREAVKNGEDEKEARKKAKDAQVYVNKRSCEIERLARGCTGVKRTTGQHPGGIIVVPHNMEIYTFTPIQHPANDMTTDIVTTHFEYHSIDHNLLKLDNLGHDDPTMIRRLEDLTGVKASTVKLDDKDVMSLFHSTEVLGIKPEDIGGTKLGSLGIPEFGTDFVIGMLLDTKPKSFSDLVRISGLSHGTDVWLGNAQQLIEDGVVDISHAICCRDDIMVYLIHMGLDPAEAFNIMERVRKGKVASGKCEEWPQWVEDMKAHGVPDWYIGSCQKIKYMFPKAHACAYVMMAWRIAWYKVNYPLAYYAAFFSIRAKAMNYMTMCRGREILDHAIEENRKKEKNVRTANDDVALRDMRLVQEMYARGFEFMPIDLFRVDATRYQVIDGRIMPAMNSIEGLGDSAAQQIVDAKEGGPYLSKEDLKNRAHVGQSTIDKLSEAGILEGLSDKNQLSFNFS